MTTLPVTFDLDELERRLTEAMDRADTTDDGDYTNVVIDLSTAVMAAALVTAYRELAADVERRVRDAVAAHVRQGDTAAGRWEG